MSGTAPLASVVTCAVVVLSLVACGTETFAVGDCVTIEQRTLDHDLKAASCSEATGNPLYRDAIYAVDEVIDGSNGTCGSPRGFRPTTFSDRSADKTYCLSVAD